MRETFTSINEYFDEIRTFIANYQNIIINHSLTYDQRTKYEGTLFGKISLIDRSELTVRDYIFIDNKTINIIPIL